jgi:N6-L-threonylcarbamoyladenine synthase
VIILGIETSCDETGVAVYDTDKLLLVHKLYSQAKLHAEFGGVVPELASRDHVQKLLPLVKNVLTEAEIVLHDLTGIAYTSGPGLIGALLVGAAFAESLGFGLKIPVIPINHIEAHFLVTLLETNPPDFPFLVLLVSGGHTQLVEALALGQYKILGETLDDAIGEAFDKVAKVLGLPYPGGPELAKLAFEGSSRFSFPRPMKNSKGLNFSFSGLKTCSLEHFQKYGNNIKNRADIAQAFQDAATDILIIKCKRALEITKLNRLVVAGGVSANVILRKKLNCLSEETKTLVYLPRLEFCTDNGAMIAYTGAQYLLNKRIINNFEIKAHSRLPLCNFKR